MKVVIVLLGMMSLVAENSYGFGSARSSANNGGDSTTPSVPSLPAPPNTDLGTGGVKVVINSAKNFNATQAAHLEESRALLERIVNSEEFKQKVIHFTYQGQETYVQNNGLTNLQVYNKIMAGAEEFPQQTAANNVIDLSVQLYTSGWTGRNVIGYTNPSTPTIYMNTYFYNYATPIETASNMIHEWTHKLGFDHDYKATARRPYSVPYAVGYIVENMGK